MRTAKADPGAEAPTLYSRVGRRSSPGLPAVPIQVESLRAAPPAPASQREPPPPPPVSDPDEPSVEVVGSSDHPPNTERTARSRPPAPEPFRADISDGESIAHTLDRLIASEARLDHAPAFPKDEALTGPRELFETLAAAHVRPVRELLIELRWGDAAKDSFVAAAAAVQSLRGAAEKLALVELAVALASFGEALTTGEQDVRDAAARANMIGAYDELVRLLPSAFGFEAERAQRETVIIQSLVLHVPDAHRTTLERIVAAGLGTIGALADARPSELADVAGIPLAVAAGIVEAVHSYRERQHGDPSAEHAGERTRLRALSTELAEQHGAFERASGAWTREATEQRRAMRRARERTLLEISALLARLGEVPLLERLEKVPFEQKLEKLRTYLNETNGASAAHAR